MIEVTCTKKIRDSKYLIIGYTITDSNNNSRYISSNELKKLIELGEISVTNLTLCSDGKLRSKRNSVKDGITKDELKLDHVREKLIKSGFDNNWSYETPCEHYVHLYWNDKGDGVLIIPSDVKIITPYYNQNRLIYYLGIRRQYSNQKPRFKRLKVYGGNGLESTKGLFEECRIELIDLTDFDTQNVRDMSCMFKDCQAQLVKLTNINTSNVLDMKEMFMRCEAVVTGLWCFDTKNVEDMSYMFAGCRDNKLDLSMFDTGNVWDMSFMFARYTGESLDLSNFRTGGVRNMESMFDSSKFESLDISKFNTYNVTNMKSMFFDMSCDSVIDLSNFDTYNLTNTEYMFGQCFVNELKLTNFNMSNVHRYSKMFSGANIKSIELSDDTKLIAEWNKR
ncbi:MAG: BspA family leucine-rich repeat surface protein [Lachnospiraceae bacterium]|nr:BspA family leucine-rich repeat surface protein [Lachnospiraceae bacterium]